VQVSTHKACPILLATLMVLSLAGCAMHPTPIPSASLTLATSATATPSPTTAPTPTDTPAPSPTITPPQIILSDEQFACIGIGTTPWSLYHLTGIPLPTEGFVPLLDLLVSDERVVHFGYAMNNEGEMVVSSIEVAGEAPIVAKPDVHPVADGTLVFRGFDLKVGSEIVLADMLAACGTPDGTSTFRDKAYVEDVWTKMLEYPGITIALNQFLKPDDPSKWTILRVTLTESKFVTPRGLHVGMTVGEAVRLLGTGTFEMNLVMNGFSVVAISVQATQPPYQFDTAWYLTVVGGRITTIATNHIYYDA
jgi:hypothetical protein